jgi:hypothetical protein
MPLMPSLNLWLDLTIFLDSSTHPSYHRKPPLSLDNISSCSGIPEVVVKLIVVQWIGVYPVVGEGTFFGKIRMTST